VLFFTQDDPAGYLFRFIAATAATDGTALDSGTLAVAQIQGNGIIWVDLGTDIPTLAGTIGAAQTAGGSAFDAPGGLALAAGNAALYLACAGNINRTAPDALNPRASDDNGHVLMFTPPGGDVTAKSFSASLVLVAGEPGQTPGTQYGPGSEAWLRKPRTLNIDPAGALWIGTDQGGQKTRTADGLFTMQTGGAVPYALSAAYLAPLGAAIGGAAFDARTRTSFGMVRHPGATPDASFNNPATRWPTLAPNMPPQSTIIGLVSL
jgi:secreted PhoX family phosphatase